MRQAQRLRYAEKIERVVQYLQNLDWSENSARSDLATLASVAGLSPYHFHRIFRLMTGEPIGDLVRRLRVARAIFAHDDVATVTEQALMSGYATPQAFARAVHDVTGVSPSVLLETRELAANLQAKLLQRIETHAASARPPLSVEITSIDPFTVQAIRNIGDYRELNRAYERLFALAFADAPVDSLCGIFGVPLDDPFSVAARECHFYCGVQLDVAVTVPVPVRPLELGGGVYVVARHVGSYDLVHGAIDLLIEALLECDALILADAPIHLRYLDQPELCAEGELRSDIFIPVGRGEYDA